jgi:hypothetical protein
VFGEDARALTDFRNASVPIVRRADRELQDVGGVTRCNTAGQSESADGNLDDTREHSKLLFSAGRHAASQKVQRVPF